MWNFLKNWRLARKHGGAQGAAGPALEALEDRLLLTTPPTAQVLDSEPPTTSKSPSATTSRDRSSSIAATRGAPRPAAGANPNSDQPPPAQGPGGGMGGDMGGGPGGGMGPPGRSGGGGMSDPRQATASGPRPGLVSRDPGSQLSAFAHPREAAAASAASRTALAMHLLFTDMDDALPLVEVTGNLSFVEVDSQLTDREFTALITNTRPRLDVVPQQGSAVASVATLMPSDRAEIAEQAATSEFTPLLITPLNLPTSAPSRASAPMTVAPTGGHVDTELPLPPISPRFVEDGDGEPD
jgi:hypothetical protein